MVKRGIDDYLSSAQESYNLASERANQLSADGSSRAKGLKSATLKKFISSAKDYAKAGELSSEEGNTGDAADYFEMASNSANGALRINPKDPSTIRLRDDYVSESKRLEDKFSGPQVEKTLFGVTLAASFIFGVDLLSHNITGSAIASGNTPIDLGAGALLLIASVIGIFFLVKHNASPHPPHPEKKKSKKKK